MSEFGFQSYPSLKTLKENFNESDLNFDSPILQTHQKHNRGNELIKTYLERDFPQPNNFYQFIYLSQLLQAEGISHGIETLRRSMPYCMGSIYWQLNDCWPAISWSGIDYGGRWKALQYFAKENFKSVFISAVKDNNTLKIFIVNDMLDSLKGTLHCNLIKFDGTPIDSIEKDIIVYPNCSRSYLEINMGRYKNINKDESFFELKFLASEQLMDERDYFFVKPKELKLVNPEIVCTIERNDDNYKLALSSKSFAKNVFIDIDQDGKLSDNYFDLIPAEKKEITFYPKIDLDKPLNVKIISLWDVIKNKLN